MRSSSIPLAGLSIASLLGAACASSPPPLQEERRVRNESPEPQQEQESLSVSGLRGTLSQHEIQGALQPRLPKLLRCVQARLPVLEALAGTVSMRFDVAVSGNVEGVRMVESTLGDRETERCMLELARATRFPAPHGGEAEFVWPLEVPIDSDVRPPVELAAEPARSAIARDADALHARCGGGQTVVTVYLTPEGSVLSAGVAAPDIATESELDCVAQGVRGLRFASPGSYLGKLSFTLP